MPIPSELETSFSIAKSIDIRSWSFGALTSPRQSSTTFHDNAKGTLHDQRIFGPLQDFNCVCGKYQGEQFANMICDRCGVKVTYSSARSERFGHIEFTTDVPHPFDTEVMMTCFPIVPADFMQSEAGKPLQTLYDQLIASNNDDKPRDVFATTVGIVELLTPVVVILHNWSLHTTRDQLARGIALLPRD